MKNYLFILLLGALAIAATYRQPYVDILRFNGLTTAQIDAESTEGQMAYDTDTNTLKIRNDSAWTEVGSGSGAGFGAVNYVTNYGAETNTDGWTAYDDAAAAAVDCTGGTSSVFTRNTSGPLRGDGDFDIAGAGAEQGEGVAYAFSIDNADTYKRITVSMDAVGDANFTTGDIVFAVYDVTNTQLVTLRANSDAKRLRAAFNATDSTSYRFCVHIATNNTFTFNFDNVQIGPDRIVDQPVKEQMTFDETTLKVWDQSANSEYDQTYTMDASGYRDGEFLVISGHFVDAGGNTAGTGDIGLKFTNLTVATDYADQAPVGTGDEGGNAFGEFAVHYDSGSGLLELVDSSLARELTVEDIDLGGDFQFEIKVKIAEWVNSDALFSTHELINTVERIKRSTNAAQVVPAATVTYVEFEDVDTGFQDLYWQDGVGYNSGTGAWTTDPGFVAPRDGDIVVMAATDFTINTTAGHLAIFSIHKNGVEVCRPYVEEFKAANTGTIVHPAGPCLIPVSANDVISYALFVTAGATLTGTNARNYFSAHYVTDQDVLGVTGAVEILPFTGSAFSLTTSGWVSGEWAQMTNNSVALTPGKWRLVGYGDLDDSSGTIEGVRLRWSTANGDNTTSAPTGITQDAGSIEAKILLGTGDLGDSIFNASTVILTISTNTTVYLNANIAASVVGTSTITVGGYAERIQ